MEIRGLRDFEYSGKRVFLRVDFNCPIHDGVVTDDTRIRAALPTLEFLLQQGAKVVMGSHLGRPEGKRNAEFSLGPVAERLQELTGKNVLLMDDPMSDAPKALINRLKKNEVILLENLRFSPDEKARTGKIAQHWASYTDVYVNDAFGVCHRKDSSVYDLPLLVPDRAMGLLIEKEISFLGETLDAPKQPYAIIFGGAKVSDKIPLIERVLEKVDIFVIGGAMAFTFLKAMGKPVGNSLVEEDLVKFCKDLLLRLEARDKKVYLPTDFVEAEDIESSQGKIVSSLSSGLSGFDIGPGSTRSFLSGLSKAKTILWNGPMGVFENPAFSRGTRELCEGLSKMDSIRIVGGGDTAAAARKFEGAFDHVSTGGGASLSFLQGKELPGIQALKPTRRELLEQSREVLKPLPFDEDELGEE